MMIDEQELVKDLLKISELVNNPDFYSIPSAIDEIIDKINNRGYENSCYHDVVEFYKDDED